MRRRTTPQKDPGRPVIRGQEGGREGTDPSWRIRPLKRRLGFRHDGTLTVAEKANGMRGTRRCGAAQTASMYKYPMHLLH